MDVRWKALCGRSVVCGLILLGGLGCQGSDSGKGAQASAAAVKTSTGALPPPAGETQSSAAAPAKSGGAAQVTKDALFTAGDVLPPLKLKNMAGEEVSLDAWKGKVVLLNFWATWCVPCVAEMPALERLYKTYKDAGLEVVAVSVDQDAKLPDVEKFLKANGITFTVLRDPEFSTPPNFGLTGFPESFFISREGKLVSVEDPSDHAVTVRVVGDRPWDSPAFIKVVGELVKQGGPSTTVASDAK